jgi:hypothetical protein
MMRSMLLSLLGIVAFGAISASAASAQSCPNEALRSELRSGLLPDCRAYELVTPVYKEGQVAANTVYALSADGSHMIATMFGAFAGTREDRLGDQLLGVPYEFTRTATGWKASSLGAPASTYLSNGVYDVSADLSRSLWELATRPPAGSPEAEQPEGVQNEASVMDFYIESSPGVFAAIGRPTSSAERANRSQFHYLGGSEDLARVLFSVEPGFRWPFDKTAAGANTLYEYVGIGNKEPLLVGVNGPAGSEDLVSECGTSLGSAGVPGGGSTYNAISASGARVFFTAVGTGEASGCEGPPVGELFAREEQPLKSGEAPAAKMVTVAISEPSKEDCKACLTGEGSRAPAVFQGASLDGSEVFFTTAQELLPGAKGGNLYEYDFNGPAGAKVTLVSRGAQSENAEVQGVARVSEDGSTVYFVASGRLTGASNRQGYPAEAGKDNLYAFERGEGSPEGRTSFVATLSAGDAGDWRQADFRPVHLSIDGRFLVFPSEADLTHEGTTPGVSQVYQYDSQTGALVRASIGQGGYNNDGRTPVGGSGLLSKLPAAYAYSGVDSPAEAAGVLTPSDGAVFFQSADALTPQALSDQVDELGDPVPNIYEYRQGSVYLISDGRDLSTISSGPSAALIGSSASGDDVFFATADSLLPGDTDTQQDVYDAHVGGGFPVPSVPGCEEEACRGALSQMPPLAAALPAPEPETVQSPAVVKPVKAKAKAKRKRSRSKTGRRHGRKATKASYRGHASHRGHAHLRAGSS